MNATRSRLLLAFLAPVLLATPAAGQLPDWLGAINVSPPRHDNEAALRMSGIWSDTCVPDAVEAIIEPGRIELVLDVPALNVGCGDAPTEWSIYQDLGPLTPWTTYEIYGTVELVDPNDRSLRRHDAGPDLLIDDYLAELLADFDRNGRIDATDADLLGAAQRAGGPLDPYDLNDDGRVNRDDRIEWLYESPIVGGDSDQNGSFNSSDLVKVFQAGQYEDGVAMNSIWVTGDWDGDAEFTSADFVFVFNQACYEDLCCHHWCGPRPDVPEPSNGIAAFVGIVMLMIARRAKF